MSPRVRHICYFLDYGALSLYSLGEPHGGGGGQGEGSFRQGGVCGTGVLGRGLSSRPAPPPGCAFPYAAYSMPASWLHSHLHQLFVPAAALNSFLCTGLSCYSRWVLGQW